MIRFAVAALLGFMPLAQGADIPWPQNLSLANGGFWPERVPIAITNSSSERSVGKPLTVSVPALAGNPVNSIRVADADGTDLLFDLRDKNGLAKREGALIPNDRILSFLPCLRGHLRKPSPAGQSCKSCASGYKNLRVGLRPI